ncbi:MAG: sodium-dependent transporter, partial [Firmicutes bacterium]|nr:sodium-dependent transporter [Bacillota bacterium]
MSKKEERGSFSGRLGFVLAAAASAVGLGNIWRFPYLAAKDGGGLFLLVYVCLALTFGFTLLTTEIAIGRKSGKSPLQAYGTLCSKMNWIGAFACIIPAMITPYYSSIGGWILKYMTTFVTGHGVEAAADGYFGGFITSQWSPIIWFLIYMALNIFVVFKGVNDGIEKMSKFMMPVLVILIAGISVFSLTLKHTDAAGVTRT